MPEGYTHLRCAWRAARAQKLTADLHREAFFAGANGPDMLFCYQVWKPARKRAYPLPDLGERMHNENTGAFLRALLLGDKKYLDEEDASNLSEVGLSHVMAVSGLHCCFLASLIGALMGGRQRKLRCAVTIPLLFLYAFVTGLTPSILRACIMISMGMIAPLLGRDNDPPTSISFALLLILLKNPFAIASISLQLSFSAVAGIIFLTPKLVALARGKHKLLRAAMLSFSTTLGAMAFSTPLACYYFGTLSIVSLLSNLLCLWLVSIVFALGLLSVIVAAAVPQLGAACAFVPALGIRAVLAIAGLLEELPFHAIYFNTAFSVAWLAYVYAIFITCALAKRGKYRYFAAVGLSVLSLFAAAKVNALHYEQGGLNVVALDVGQGESVLLISEGHAALVDCGSKNSYIDAGAIAADYLRSAGATLDSVVLTHYHEDHANGLAALFARVDVDTIYLADIDAGELVPDDVVIGIIKERLAESDCANGYILDGFPRSIIQAEALDTFQQIDCAVNLEVDNEAIVKRLSGRRFCPDCNGTYHVSTLADEKVCPNCKGTLIVREDDKEHTVRNRLSVYEQTTLPLVDYYARQGKLVTVDGNGTVDEVYGRILSALKQ